MPAFSAGRLKLNLDPATTAFLPPHLHALSRDMVYPKPSTGFRMIALLEFALQAGFQAVGFGFFDTAQMHYFDQDQTRLQVGEVHATQFERDFVSQLLKPHARFGRYE